MALHILIIQGHKRVIMVGRPSVLDSDVQMRDQEQGVRIGAAPLKACLTGESEGVYLLVLLPP